MGVVVLLFHSGYRTLLLTGRIGTFGWKSCCCCRRRAAAVSSLSSAWLLSSSWEKNKIHQHSSLSLLQCKTDVFDMHPSSSHEAIGLMGDFPLRVNASTLLLCCDLRERLRSVTKLLRTTPETGIEHEAQASSWSAPSPRDSA
jgi:hypothetical protein